MDLEITKKIIESGAVSFRKENETPFVYSSGNQGPAYIMIKGLCGQPDIMHYLIDKLADKLSKECPEIDFINGNVTGGVVTGWELRNILSEKLSRSIPFVYLRGARKKGGHDELITGIHNNKLIKKGMEVIIVEELVNYGTTTLNAVEVFRNNGYIVRYATTILSYNHISTNKKLEENGVKLIPLIKLDDLLSTSIKYNLLDKSNVMSYLNFLNNSTKWQLDRNFPIPDDNKQIAINMGYNLKKMSLTELEKFPQLIPKYKQGINYWKKIGTQLLLALDMKTDIIDLIEKAKKTLNYDIGYKINLDSIILKDCLKSRLLLSNKPIFVDLKMWNGIRTMKRIIKEQVKNGVDIVNVYGHIGKSALKELSLITNGTNTKLFVLTVLTHYDDVYCKELYGKTMEETINMFCDWAKESECDGVILPAKYIYIAKNKNLLSLCPAIRFKNSKNPMSNNQIQYSTINEAVKNGANYIVMGTPILCSDNIENKLKDALNIINN